MRKLTTIEFVDECRKVHGDRYDYYKTVYQGQKQKVTVTCRSHGDYEQTAGVHSQGTGCPSCAAVTKPSTSKIIEKFRAVHGDTYDYSKVVYVRVRDKVEIICKTHGSFLQLTTNHLIGHGCPKCAGKQKTTEDFIAEASLVHGWKYTYSKTKYTLATKQVTITCARHGDFKQLPSHHLVGHGCPKCHGHGKTTDEFLVDAKHTHGDLYDYSLVEYVDSKTHIRILCKQHGEFTQRPSHHVDGRGCPKCGQCPPSSMTEFVPKARIVHGERYKYINAEYVNSITPIKITCTKHGDFEQIPSSHLAGSGCPSCVGSKSSYEDALYAKYPFFERTNRSVLNPKHLDLYSEEHKLAIEVNGRYWHSENYGKLKGYHLSKTEGCLSKGITLLHFWDDELLRKSPIVESMINARLGVNRVIYGRKTKLVYPSSKETSDFLENNHLQGSCQYAKSIGLEFEGVLVAVMTFGRPRFNTKYSWEILRFANVINSSVVGGASKLFKEFIKSEVGSVITYADRRYSNGGLYTSLGFRFSHNSEPTYFYTRGSVNINRYKAQKHKLYKLLGDKFDPTLSESKNMSNCGFFRVYDCGTKVFVLDR